jgi:predicted nucleic acid-binding protein
LIKAFVDSSAYAKIFVVELGSGEMVSFLNNPQNSITVSAVVRVEVRSAIRRRQSLHQMTQNDAEVAIAFLFLNSYKVSETPMDLPVLREAALLVDRRSLRSLDAIQLASAILVKAQAEPGTRCLFVAADLKLLQAAEAKGFLTWNPADGPCVL